MLNFRERKSKHHLTEMLARCVTTNVNYCAHQRPSFACRVCQMRTFLLVRKTLTTDHGCPLLIRDVCTLIFAQIHNTDPIKDGAWSLTDCGPLSRVPNDCDRAGAVCGVCFVNDVVPGVKLYCKRPAIKQGKCHQWTCMLHFNRANADPVKKPLRNS